MASSYRVAVVGASGNVGREILSILEERSFPIKSIDAVASENSKGARVSFGEKKELPIVALGNYDFKGIDFAFFSPGERISQLYAPQAAKAGAIVIDNTAAFRLEQDVPLIVPEVNASALKKFSKRRIIANPNCVAIPLAMALKPLHNLARVKRVVISTYQSTSGAGRKAMDELYHQTRAMFMNSDYPSEEFPKSIAFNVIPHIGNFMKDASTEEEYKISCEIRKIVDPDIQLAATCVRVPVFIGHSISATLEFEKEITSPEASKALSKAAGIRVIDNVEEETYATPAEIAGEDHICISRIRKDPTVPHGLSLWIVSDNLRKGAALNAVQIAEVLIKEKLY